MVNFAPDDQSARNTASKTTPGVPSAQQASMQVGATGIIPNNWVLPVAGMSADNWSKGSFGYVGKGRTHEGTDIYMPRGSSVVAPIAGTVIAAGNGDISGHYVRIKGNDGITYYFAHLDQPPNVARGQRVSAGNHIGFVGNSGNAKGTSTHLHFKMSRGGKPVSPNEFLATGKQQKFSGMDSIAGINTVEEMQAWIAEQSARMAASYGLIEDNDMSGLGEAMSQSQYGSGIFKDGEGIGGERVLANVLANLSNTVAGGERRLPPKMGTGGPMDTGTATAATMGSQQGGLVQGAAEVGVEDMREPTPEVEGEVG